MGMPASFGNFDQFFDIEHEHEEEHSFFEVRREKSTDLGHLAPFIPKEVKRDKLDSQM